MSGRTIAVGDIHGDLDELLALLALLPPLDASDTLVFLGDYLDRGPRSAEVIEVLRRTLPEQTLARIVTLRGNHEDAWLRVRREGFLEFLLPHGNGCLDTLRSFLGQPPPAKNHLLTADEFRLMADASFFPADVVEWMAALPCWYEDAHAIYVHAGLPLRGGRFLHPRELTDPKPLLWDRSELFLRGYRGKRVVFGHTVAECLPQGLSRRTPDDPKDAFVTPHLVGLDTRCGHGGFLSAVELPGLVFYETRQPRQTAQPTQTGQPRQPD